MSAGAARPLRGRRALEYKEPPPGAVAVLMTIPMYLIYYAVQPWPGAVVVKQIVFDVIGVLAMGVVVALINQGPKPA
jgi:hypothetical protein